MPYITLERREELWGSEWEVPEHPGELNYMISQLCRNYLDVHGYRYQYMNDVLGALEGAKLEFYRCAVAPYEDQKKHENGAVYL